MAPRALVAWHVGCSRSTMTLQIAMIGIASSRPTSVASIIVAPATSWVIGNDSNCVKAAILALSDLVTQARQEASLRNAPLAVQLALGFALRPGEGLRHGECPIGVAGLDVQRVRRALQTHRHSALNVTGRSQRRGGGTGRQIHSHTGDIGAETVQRQSMQAFNSVLPDFAFRKVGRVNLQVEGACPWLLTAHLR